MTYTTSALHSGVVGPRTSTFFHIYVPHIQKILSPRLVMTDVTPNLENIQLTFQNERMIAYDAFQIYAEVPKE